MRHNFLITGASGFVGSTLVAALYQRSQFVRRALRAPMDFENGIESVSIGNIDGQTGWREALRNIDVVIHLAARVHVMSETAGDPLAEFLEVNLLGTANLARQAAQAGVKRLVYVSSIKVNGENTFRMAASAVENISPDGTASHSTRLSKDDSQVAGYSPPFSKGETKNSVFTEKDAANPQDPYGISKWQAEQALQRIAQETGLEVVIVRPPLVYGPGVKGNFAQLLKVLTKGIPLPLASVHNLRSLLYVENLVDALIVCAMHPAAAGQTYLVSDGEDISTPDLLRQLGTAMGHPAHLFSCPSALLKLAGRLTGKSNPLERLLGSLQVDSGKIRRELDWTPPYTLQQGLRATADWYRSEYPR